MAEIGYISLIIALPVAVISIVLSIICIRSDSSRLINASRGSIIAVFGLYTLALVIILYAFITRDFSLKAVVDYASRDLSIFYTLAALYASKAGSMFFWGWLISLFTLILVLRAGKKYQPLTSYALTILTVLETLFVAMATFGLNIFEKHPSPPADGFGLNPLLQNFGMLIHPPLLYLGFAGFAVVFALSMAALINRRPAAEWIARVRGWTIFSWCALGIGNLIGMWWSYNELGWGGYWAWDPVENAGLMPWVLGTAFLHSIIMFKQRNYLKRWSFYLIIFTFELTLLSPFITHGGIESPLHGFYGSPLPPYILMIMIITIISSLALAYNRCKGMETEKKPASLLSREGAFLLTNIILIILVIVIFTGTFLPKIVEVIRGTKLAIDRSFFDRTCGPVMLVLVLLMGICPVLGWSRTTWQFIKRNLFYVSIIAIVIAIVVMITGIGNWYALAVIICGIPLGTIFLEWYRRTRGLHRAREENIIRGFFSVLNRNRGRYGGFISHIGVILIALGIIVSSFYDIEKTETLSVGESMDIGNYNLTYNELVLKQDNVKLSAVASLSVNRNNRRTGIMYPSYDYWFDFNDCFAEVAVRTTPVEDLFVSLVWTSYNPEDNTATFRVLVNPMVVWIWVGGGFFLVGGAIAFSAKDSLSIIKE